MQQSEPTMPGEAGGVEEGMGRGEENPDSGTGWVGLILYPCLAVYCITLIRLLDLSRKNTCIHCAGLLKRLCAIRLGGACSSSAEPHYHENFLGAFDPFSPTSLGWFCDSILKAMGRLIISLVWRQCPDQG